MARPKVLVAAWSLVAGNGGIARSCRLYARVLHEMQQEGLLDVRGLTMNDTEPVTDLGFEVSPCHNSKAEFVARVSAAKMYTDYFLYDFAGMAQAHRFMPLIKRPYMTVGYGIDLWEGVKPGYVNAARQADKLLFITNYSKGRAESVHGAFPGTEICWLATEDDEPPKAGPAKMEGPPTLLIVARLGVEMYKGHEELIGCWDKVREQVPDARLVLVGSGPDEARLKGFAAQTKSGDAIEFRGFVPEEELSRAYEEAWAFAMPSRGEGFGIVYAEAMRCSLPVIASVYDAGQETNVDGVTGFNIDHLQEENLVEAVTSLLGNRERCREMGAAGFQRWQDHFRYRAFAKRFRPHVENFLSSGAAPTLEKRSALANGG